MIDKRMQGTLRALAAAADSITTKKKAMEVLKEAGLTRRQPRERVVYLVQALIDSQRKLTEERFARFNNRIARRLGYTPVEVDDDSFVWRYPAHGEPSTTPVPVFNGTPKQRLQQRRAEWIRGALKQHYSIPKAPYLHLCFTSKGPSVSMHKPDVWVRLPADWWSEIKRRDMAVINGKITASANPIESCSEAQVYAAKWIEQGARRTLEMREGFIASYAGIACHGPSVHVAAFRLRSMLMRNAEYSKAA